MNQFTFFRRFLISSAVMLLLLAELAAHDFWIEPSSFRPAVGSLVAARLRVGEKLQGDPVQRSAMRIQRFFITGPGGEKPMAGRDGEDPAGLARIDGSGVMVIGYRSNTSHVELDPEKFEQYLREEGLEQIIARRAELGHGPRKVREIYSRCAKALLAAGAGESSGYNRVVGFTLELVPENNPYELKPGEEFNVRLFYEGKPVKGVLVAALSRKAPEQLQSVRTDGDGRASLRLPHSGVWLVKAVHMIPVQDEAVADWESLWASLTFEVSP
ncbi:MAG: DUF4198 domain-containing protein [Acidobacteriota bacterium]